MRDRKEDKASWRNFFQWLRSRGLDVEEILATVHGNLWFGGKTADIKNCGVLDARRSFLYNIVDYRCFRDFPGMVYISLRCSVNDRTERKGVKK